MIYGYCRYSTDRQILENQHYEIEKYAKENKVCIQHWIQETISSRKPLKDRKLGKLLKELKSGDILIATELSRLGRSMLEVMGILQECLEKNCCVWTIKENYKLGGDITSKVLAFAFGLSAEIDRKLISDRTKMSMEKLKSEGRRLGRPVGSKAKKTKLSNKEHYIFELLAQGVSKSKIATELKVDKTTLYRFMIRINAEKENKTTLKKDSI